MAVLDSQAVAEHFLEGVRKEARALPFVPCLATLTYRPTADEASVQYRDLILKDARRLGVKALALEASTLEGLKDLIRRSNDDPDIHGIVVLYPLRTPERDEDVMDLVSPYKDAEGLHSLNLGYLIKFKIFLDEPRRIKCIVPATPKAIVKSLQAHPEVRIEGAFVTVVNNSMRIGKPLGLMLENLGATVVKCYHLTGREHLERCVRSSDIVVSAVPDPAFRLDPSWIRDGAAVLDVSHQGNVDAKALDGRTALVTTPENRLGRVTRAMMFVNLLYCARYKGVYYG